MSSARRISAVRSFNRFWTRRIGLLQPGLVDTPFSLTEARVIFELAQQEVTPMAEVREALGLDAGYLSRLIRRLRDQGIVATETSSEDGRRQVIRLTRRGRSAYATINERSTRRVAQVLADHTDYEQERLVGAMATIERIVASPATTPELRAPGPGDYGWVVHRHAAAAGRSWSPAREAALARWVAEFAAGHDPDRERAWIADIGGDPVGSVFCFGADRHTARLELLFVEPIGRRGGIGSMLVGAAVDFAAAAGYAAVEVTEGGETQPGRRLLENHGFEPARPGAAAPWRRRLDGGD